MFENIIRMDNPNEILDILYKSMPFYICYAFCVIIQSVLISVGKTNYIFYECLIVNFVYYGIMYLLVKIGFFTVSMDFIIVLFGVGLIVSLVIDIFFYQYSKKHIPNEFK